MAMAASNGHGAPSPVHVPEISHEDRFYALRTVVFYPVVREDPKSQAPLRVIEYFVREFGEVIKVKYLFGKTYVQPALPQLIPGDEYKNRLPDSVEITEPPEYRAVGCIIVVYRSTAGAYSAVHGVNALKERLGIKRFLKVRVLWPVSQFLSAVDNVHPDVAAVRQEREVLVLMKPGFTLEHLKAILIGYGSIESIQKNPPRQYLPANGQVTIPAVLVTFVRPLDAASFLSCFFYGNPEAKLCIRDSNNSVISIFPFARILLSGYDIGELVPDTYFGKLLLNVRTEHQKEISDWRNPIIYFSHRRFLVQGTLRPYFLPTKGDYVPNIIIATADEHGIYTFYEVQLDFEYVLSGLLSRPARYVSGRRRWVCFFQVDITKVYDPDRRYQVTHRIKSMNHIFPHLYPHVFDVLEHNFAFKNPVDLGLRIVDYGYMKASQRQMLRTLCRGCSPNRYPFLRLVDRSEVPRSQYDWKLPVIVISDLIRTHTT